VLRNGDATGLVFLVEEGRVWQLGQRRRRGKAKQTDQIARRGGAEERELELRGDLARVECERSVRRREDGREITRREGGERRRPSGLRGEGGVWEVGERRDLEDENGAVAAERAQRVLRQKIAHRRCVAESSGVSAGNQSGG
jgi:hypothetical protein